ncbi:Ig-like domain repeat protein [Streptomyces sp. TRM68416]|uniref:Ig-like domain repeat protein n=1 Tax=Streptomyces sp. TRM68416 TaxID=2758412 RepID=UPI001661BC40|nr:Ig-like domain repeat protein [Streptomyces sp. TRM68416]MBD0843125.1 Ig-like domain repeat protein [Streptomyces sp. TRM68416]
MNTARRSGRLAATVLAAALTGTGLTLAAAPAAHAAASDRVAKLPFTTYSALAVDSVHERVFVADANVGSNVTKGHVAVYTFQGERLSTIELPYYASGLALSDDASTLYIGERHRVWAYDTTTLTYKSLTGVGSDQCGREVVVAGGKPYFTTQWTDPLSQCATATSHLETVSNGTYQRTGWNDAGKLLLEGGPNDTFVMGQALNSSAPNPFLSVFDGSGETPVRGATRRFADADGKGALNLKDIAVSPDGTKLALADATAGTRLLDAADLSDAPAGYQALPAGATASSVAFSGDGKYIARGASATGATPDLLVQPADPADSGTPLEFVFEGSQDGDRVVPRGMEWSADGARLFAVTTNASGNQFWLHIIQPPAVQYDVRFTGSLGHSPAQAVAGEPLAVRGKLEWDGPAPGTPMKVAATRTDADGTHDLGTFTVKADGSYAVLDEPALVGDATYTVSYRGDLTHRPANDVTHTVSVGKAASSIALTAPEQASMRTGVEITGRFTAQGRALPERAVLTVRRTDRLGSGTLSSVTVAADGTFTVNDIPRTRRETTYTVSWPGDDLHEGATASATVYVTR